MKRGSKRNKDGRKLASYNSWQVLHPFKRMPDLPHCVEFLMLGLRGVWTKSWGKEWCRDLLKTSVCGMRPRSHLHTDPYKSPVRQFSQKWVWDRRCYLVAVTLSTWKLRGVRGNLPVIATQTPWQACRPRNYHKVATSHSISRTFPCVAFVRDNLTWRCDRGREFPYLLFPNFPID